MRRPLLALTALAIASGAPPGASAAYVYGVAPLSVSQTVQRFPENRMLSIGALVDPAVKTVVALRVAASA